MATLASGTSLILPGEKAVRSAAPVSEAVPLPADVPMGFFTLPIRTTDGIIEKRYKGALDEAQANQLTGAHSRFIAALASIGINVPPTSLSFEERDGRFYAKITQSCFQPFELARHIVMQESLENAQNALSLIISDAVNFCSSGLMGTHGFHPTIRNYAIRDGKAWMIDTFPPYADEATTRQMMAQHMPNSAGRFLLKFGSFWLRMYTAEYYNPSVMLGGIAASVNRQRPELLNWVRREIIFQATEAGLRDLDSIKKRVLTGPVTEKRFWLQDILRARRVNVSSID